MKDLSSSFWIKCKGLLFLLLGLLSSALLLLLVPDIKAAVLLAIAVWSFCRCYYFAFYVIEKYVDSKFRFSGLCSFAKYLISKESKVPVEASGSNSRVESTTEDKSPS